MIESILEKPTAVSRHKQAPLHAEWLAKISEAGVRRRAEHYLKNHRESKKLDMDRPSHGRT